MNEKSVGVERQRDLQSISDEIKKENIVTQELLNRLYYFSERLKPNREIDSKSPNEEMAEPDGFVANLKHQKSLLAHNNACFELILNRLEEII